MQPRTTSDSDLGARLDELLAARRPQRVVFTTGAGFSAASGIPTFRGPEGYWTVGSDEYHPQDMATRAAFLRMPREVWRWYLYRKGICNAAAPNVAHDALARLERARGDHFTLVTQNVDGLHLRAGNSLARTIQVHGNTDYMRPIDGDPSPIPIPAAIPRLGREDPIDDEVWDQLVSPDGRPTRPHVLWFDECYDEQLYRADSAMAAAAAADLFVVVGTSGAAAIPYHMSAALGREALFIDINPHDNDLAIHARDRGREGRGLWLSGSATDWVPRLVDALLEHSPD